MVALLVKFPIEAPLNPRVTVVFWPGAITAFAWNFGVVQPQLTWTLFKVTGAELMFYIVTTNSVGFP